MSINNATFSWSRSASPCLRNLNLNIKKGQIVAILGRVGSGKTALLSALAGNLELIEAEEFRVVANKIGWLDQRP